MFPMTPLQSWAFIIMIMLAVGMLIWALCAPAENVDTADAVDTSDDQDEPTSRPDVVYDWAEHGI